MNYNVGGTRNDFMYQAALYSLREAEKDAKEQGKNIYLVVMSAWMYEVISEHIKTIYNLKITGKLDKKSLHIMGYDVKVIEDLEYNEPIQFILGKGK